jgi:hypothetical protein
VSEVPQDPTGEYQRQQTKLRFSRKGTFWFGVVYVILGVLGFLVFLYAGGVLLWDHVSTWVSYGFIVFTLGCCAVMVFFGWRDIRQGRRAVTSQEVLLAKQRHRQTLHEVVQGNLPSTFSKGSRFLYLGLTLFFCLVAGLYWYFYLAAHTMLEYAIGYSLGAVFSLVGFLISFGGKAHQQARTEELRRILQAGEFASASGEEPREE